MSAIFSRRLTRSLTGLLFTFCLLLNNSVKAEILFEAYSRVLLGGTHVGYFVSRYDFDVKKKQFTGIYLLKTNEMGGSINETLKAVANEKLEPVSYQYNSANKTTAKTIEATFQKNKMKAKVTVNGKSQKIERTIPSGVFLSNFLSYVILKSPEGMKTGTKYEYQAIAEEDGELSSGIALVKETENYKGLKVFKIINEFKNMQFISLATDKGEMLSTSEPTQAIATEIVTDPNLATAGFTVSDKNLKLLFGNVPKGTENTLVKMSLEKNAIAQQGVSATQTSVGVAPNGSAKTLVGVTPNGVAPTSVGVTNTTAAATPSISPSSLPSSSNGATGTVKTNKPLPTIESTGTPTKQMGIPGGKGIILKSQPK